MEFPELLLNLPCFLCNATSKIRHVASGECKLIGVKAVQ